MSAFHDLHLPTALRQRLSEPLGPIYDSPTARRELADVKVLATCGDVVTADALAWGLHPFLALIDGKTQRTRSVSVEEIRRRGWRTVAAAKSPAGGLSAELQESIHRLCTSGGGLILVEGEEDLAVLPLLLELAEGSIVIYGQPGAGVCMVHVDPRTKGTARSLLQSMEAA